MAVADIQARIAIADADELAIVHLFETVHRNRRSVVDAVGRRNRVLRAEQSEPEAQGY